MPKPSARVSEISVPKLLELARIKNPDEVLDFCREYDEDKLSPITEQDKKELIKELEGVRYRALCAQFQPNPGAIRSTLEAIARRPEKLELAPDAILDHVSPYLRANEAPGTHRQDLLGAPPPLGLAEPMQKPTSEAVKTAAAFAALHIEVKSGRPCAEATWILAAGLAAVFLRFHQQLGRTVEKDDNGKSYERGPFADFVDVVLADLYHCDGGDKKVFTRDSIVRLAPEALDQERNRRASRCFQPYI